MARNAVVSDVTEELILVDDQDREVGTKSKEDCHLGQGVLHRAFSIFIFNHRDELLLQKRSAQKPLWPSYWSNTCCSHPRNGESMERAVRRRLVEELGIESPLEYLFKFKYHAQYGAIGSEREFCWVYYGRFDGNPDVNVNEIEAWRFVDLPCLDAELADSPESFTPWLQLEWAQIKTSYLSRILGSAG
jgi:isopentenyl-diphosphate delta-isomerase